MRRSAAIAFALLALCWTAAPLLACMVPEREMTAEERECCTHMLEMCGSAHMPQSHSCCKTEIRLGNTTVVKSNQQTAPVLYVVATVPVPASPQLCERLQVSEHHHPPGELLPDTTVLKI